MEIIEFCLKIYDLLKHLHLWMGGWVDGGSMGGSGQIIKNQINLKLIKIIQFCLKSYDLWKHPCLWLSVWVVDWIDGCTDSSIPGAMSNH